MTVTDEQIATVASIAYWNSIRSPDSGHPFANRSLRKLIDLSNYRGLRPHLSELVIQDWLGPRSQIQDQWIEWCADKRTSGGFYIVPASDRSLGSTASPDSQWIIGSLDSDECSGYPEKSQAVAAYILRELDFWASRPWRRSRPPLG